MALIAAVVAVVFSVIALRRTARPPRVPTVPPAAPPPSVPIHHDSIPAEFQTQLDELGRALATSMRHLAVVRYDAFDDVTGRMSFTAAILDDYGDGIVITSLHSRSESRTLLKGITKGTAGGLSPEEQQAVDRAMGAS